MGVTITENKIYSEKFRQFNVTLTGPNEYPPHHTFTTTLTSHPGAARDWLHSVLHNHRYHRHNLVVGLGVQWTPTRYYYSLDNFSAATIQLCIGTDCLIFQLTQSQTCPSILRRFLADERATFVGFWNSQDAAKLWESKHGIAMVPGMPVDVRYHVEDDCGRSMTQRGIADIAEEVLGVDVERSEAVSLSDWEVEELSLEQIKQASVDAFAAYAVGMRINAWELNSN